MGITENDIDKMDDIFGHEYGISFNGLYNTIIAMKIYNKNYNHDIDFGKFQYIKFYNDIKVVIGDKKFIIPKEKITLGKTFAREPFYEYSVPVDIFKTSYDSLIVDLGTIEIYDETGKIQRPKRKIPPVLIKKTYLTIRYNNIMQTSQDTLYRGWAEYYPVESQK